MKKHIVFLFVLISLGNLLKAQKPNRDKIESLKKYNIQKCVQWCEKFKIPCNKFSDKINIFLPVKEVSSSTDNKLIVEDVIF